jgi:hypothetical protein
MKEGYSETISDFLKIRWLCNYVLVSWFDLRRNDEDEYDDYDDDDDESDNCQEII